MKTHSREIIWKTLFVLAICAFAQVAKANSKYGCFNKKAAANNIFFQADTPKTAAHPKAKTADDDKKGPEDGIDEDILQREKQEFSRLKDPALNLVPVQRLVIARKLKDQLMIRQSNEPKSLNSIPGGSVSINALQWNERGPTNVGGRTRALMFDLNDAANGYKKVFAGGVGGGLWYTTDITAATVQWTKISDFFENIAISCIAQDPVTPNNIYVGTGEGWYNIDSIQGLGIWKSSDGGLTWTMLTSTSQFTYINSILVDKNSNVYVAGLDFGIKKSADKGNTWTTVIPGQTSGADLELASNGDIYASSGTYGARGSIFLSDFSVNGSLTGNAGTWKNITPNNQGVITPDSTSWWRIKLAPVPGNANLAFALFEGSNSTGLASIQQYNKFTNKWTVKTLPTGSSFSNGQAWYSMAAVVDPHTTSTIYIGSLDAVRSLDGGLTWSPISQWYVGEIGGLNSNQYIHADHHTYVFAPGSSTRMVMGTDGGVFYSANVNASGATLPIFTVKDNTYDVTQLYSVALHPTNNNYALTGSQDNGTQKFTATGLATTSAATGGDGGFAFIDQLNGNTQITSYPYNNFSVSVNNGGTFSGLNSDNQGAFIDPADYDNTQKNLYAGGKAGNYYRIANILSPTNAEVAVPAFGGSNVTAVTIAPLTSNRVFFGLDNGTVVRVDNANTGASKTGVILKPNPLVNASVSCVTVDPTTENHLLVTYFNYGVVHIFETKNASAATPVWTATEGNLPDMPVRWAVFFPGNSTKAIIATELGVWTTDLLNGTATTWTASNSGLANVRTDMLKFRASDRTLAAATHGRGLFTTTLPFVSATATLANLTISSGTLSPAFNSVTNTYTASVANNLTSITVTPTASVSTSTITVNGTAVASGAASGAIALAGGVNSINIVVKAPDGSYQIYTLNITRAASANDNLANLVISKGGALTPAFTTAVTTYSINEVNATTSITVTPLTSDPGATVKINGTAVISGSPSGAITLNAGPNIITTVVTAQDGVTAKTYTVTVNRAPSNNDNLTYLVLSKGGPVSPTFTNTVTSYTANVANTVTSLTVTAKTTDPGATITINGVTVASAVASPAINLSVGTNSIKTVVTAQDKITTKTITVTVTRAAATKTPAVSASFESQTASVLPPDDGILVHQGVSPNGDGINDYLKIDGITKYPDNKLMIMDRSGSVIFEARSYDNKTKVFDGHSSKNGTMQRQGTYFYSLDYTVKGVARHVTGIIVLKY